MAGKDGYSNSSQGQILPLSTLFHSDPQINCMMSTHIGEGGSLLSLPIQISSENTLTDTLRYNFLPGIGASLSLVELTDKLIITCR